MKYLLIFILLMSQNVFAQERRSELIVVIDEELSEVRRLTKQNGSNPTLLLRMAELEFEKARLVKEEENEKYLSLSPGQRKSTKKSDYFKKSTKLFQRAEKVARFLLKRYKNFKGKSDVLYILAFNAKEFGDEKNYEKYLQSSVSVGKGQGEEGAKAILALADSFYNKKQYKKAIPYYVKGLNLSKNDSWWTKYSYNLAWCYLRVKDNTRAINLLREIYTKSKSDKYLDMASQAERDLAYFYTMANRVDDAIKFYKSINADIVKYFLKVSSYLEKQGKKTTAVQTYNETLKHNPNNDQRKFVYLKLLDLYEQFRNFSSHYKVSRDVFKIAEDRDLNDEELNQYLYQLKKTSSELQRRVVDKKVKRSLKEKRYYGEMANSYFVMLEKIENKDSHKWRFHIGETNYSMGNYEEAISDYKKSYNESKNRNDSKLTKLSVEGLLSSTDLLSSKNSKKDAYVLDAYNTFIDYSPKSNQSRKIHQRLFSFYFKKKDIPNSEQTLLRFKNNFPSDTKIQEAMLAKIMDYYKDNKMRSGIAKWVDKINAGDIQVSTRYRDQLKKLLLNMKFENVEKANKSGDKKQALIGYFEIYENSKNDNVAKKNAAYNIAVLLHELGEVDRSFFWAQEAIKLMTKGDVYQFRESFGVMADELFSRRRFDPAIKLYGLILKNICNYKNSFKNSVFKNMYVINLAQEKYVRMNSDLKLAKTCKVSLNYRLESVKAISLGLIKKEKFKEAESYVNYLLKYKSYRAQMIPPLYDIYRYYLRVGDISKANSLKANLLSLARKSKNLSLEAVDILANFQLGELEKLSDQLAGMKLRFPENDFNKILQDKLKFLDVVTSKALSILKIGSGHGVVETYKILHSSYMNFSNEIKGFSPPGKSETYINSFRRGLSTLTLAIDKKAQDFFTSANREINRQQILSPSNHYFTSNLKLGFAPEFFSLKSGVLMDKAGGR